MTQDQWKVAVDWTGLLSANSSLMKANLNDLLCFQRELEDKVQGKADMNLIFWIWDEHAKLTTTGQWYKQKYQKVMLEDMQQAAKGTPQIQWSW
jgi:hypothetical protein